VLFIDVEAGTLSIADLKLDMLRPKSWLECRDIAVRIGGIDPAAALGGAYSAQHLEQAGGLLPNLDRYSTIFIDSITAVSRLSFRWAEMQPEAFNERGKKDLWGIYGLHAREFLQWLGHLQHIRSKNIIMTALLELRETHLGREWRPQIEGSKAPREMLGIVDEIVTMQWVDFGDGKPIRAFICNQPNLWNYPAKDRSGTLEQFEQPNLAKLILKLNGGVSKHRTKA
jgi:hypothetical protein